MLGNSSGIVYLLYRSIRLKEYILPVDTASLWMIKLFWLLATFSEETISLYKHIKINLLISKQRGEIKSVGFWKQIYYKTDGIPGEHVIKGMFLLVNIWGDRNKRYRLKKWDLLKTFNCQYTAIYNVNTRFFFFFTMTTNILINKFNRFKLRQRPLHFSY